MPDRKRARLVTAGFGAGLALLGGVGWLHWREDSRLEQSMARLSHLREVRTQLVQLLLVLQEGEWRIARLGYGDGTAGTQGLDAALDAATARWQQMRATAAADAELVSVLSELDHRTGESIREARAVAQAARRGGPDAARSLLARGGDPGGLRAALEVAAQADTRLQELIAARHEQVRRDSLTVKRLLPASLAVAVALLSAAFMLLQRANRLRRRASEAMQRYAAHVENLYNTAPCGYHSLDAEGRFIEINDTELAWLGFSREELLGGMRFVDRVTEPGRALFATTFPQLQAQGRVNNLEFDLVRKDGTLMAVELSAGAVYDEAGRFLCTRSTVFDVTERKRARTERDTVFELSLDLLCIAGMDGYFKRVNPAFQATLGYPSQEFLARPFLDFVHPEDRAATLLEVERLGRGEPTLRFENRYRCADGSWCWLSWTVQPFPGEELLYATARDVTREKLVAAELRERSAQLEALNRELESFSYSVSHDLRAPLRHVQGYVELLERAAGGQLAGDAARYLRVIADASTQMSHLIDDLLAFSRTGRSEIRRAHIAVADLVQGLMPAFEMEARGRRVEWRIDSLPSVVADPAMLRQVLANLIGNALKYTRPRDPARIEIGCAGREDGRIVLFVRDNGVGFDMKYAHKLFGVFQRLHRPDEFEGTGIGLATVQRIVARHGGRVWAEAAPYAGAAFYFTVQEATAEWHP